MNQEAVNQIVETIKTLNLNVDSNSMVQIVEQIKPIIWFYFVKSAILELVGWVAFVVAIYFISKAVRSYYQNREQ